MMTKRAKIIGAVLCMFLAGGTLFAGGGGQQSAAGGQASGTLSGTIRFSWWGNETRNNATTEAIRYYESLHPGVTITPEYGAVDGYLTKMLAQVAAGNAPDIFTMSAENLPQYVEVNGVLDLTGKIDVSTHNPMIVEACSINGRMYGVNLSLNANVIYYNKTQADELGITMPTGDYTWDDLVKILAEVYQKSGGKTYGMVDLRMVKAMETFIPAWNMTHRGKEPPFPWTNSDFLMKAEDVAAFMDYFNKVPQGVLLPPAETATLASQIDSPIASRKTFLAFDYTGTFAMYQSQTGDDLEMIQYPNNRRGRGAAVSARPGLIESIFINSRNQPLAVDFLQWISGDPAAGKILKTVRGVLPSSKQVDAVLADPASLSDVDKKVFAITNAVYQGTVNPFSAGILVGNIWDETHMMAVGSEVAFGRITPQEAGRRFEEFVEDAMP
jgi:multiple sugar transport system substrate-binding protein